MAAHFSKKISSWAPLFAAGIIALSALAAYHGSFSGPFIYDDAPSILDNPSIRQLWPVGPALHPPQGSGITVEGRPVLNLSFAINYAISGTKPWSYHALNLLIHICAGLTLFGLARRTAARIRLGAATEPPAPSSSPIPGSGSDPALFFAFAVALVWTLHPLQTEAVTYVIQRAESLMGLFYLLTFYGFARGAFIQDTTPESRSAWPWYLFSVIACLLGMATKEVTVTAPVMVFFYDRTFCAGRFATAWQRRWRYYLALGGTWLLLAALIASTGGNRSGSVGFGAGLSWFSYFLTQFEAIFQYLRLTVWPSPLIFEYGTFWTTFVQAAPYLVVVLILALGTIWALVRKPALGFLGFWFFGLLAPTSLAPGSTQMIVEHRMYLPLAALAALFGFALLRWTRPLQVPLLLLVAAALGWVTAERNQDYHTAIGLWQATVDVRPASARAHGSLADALVAAGKVPDALPQFAEAVRLNPKDAVVLNNYGVALRMAGRERDALARFEAALRLQPDYASAHYNLADVLARTGRPDEAVYQYQETLRLDPTNLEAANNLGDTLEEMGRLQEAARCFEAAVRAHPEDAQTCYNLANVLLRLDRPTEAIASFEQALRLNPDLADAHQNLGAVLIQRRQFAEALVHFAAAARLRPNSAEDHFNLGNALVLAGRPGDAVAPYQQALRLRPDYAAARRNLEEARRQATRAQKP